MGPGDLANLVAPLRRFAGDDARVLVGPQAGDDAGVYLLHGRALVATADFITPVCDDPRLFGRIAAANSLSDVYAMGGRPLFALNLCCFPASGVPDGVLAQILEGAAEAVTQAGAVVMGGHSVTDQELKFGLAVVGEADPGRLLTNTGAREGDRLILTKPLGTGVLINAFRSDDLDEASIEPALIEMGRLNSDACRLALAHGVRAATDVTGFGFIGHASTIAKASNVGLEVSFQRLPIHERFLDLARAGVSTGCTEANREHTETLFDNRAGLDRAEQELLFDPQTSGGLLLSTRAETAEALLADLLAAGHRAAVVGSVTAGPPRVVLL